jgi:type IV secretory pathway VirB10-like protein
MAFTTKPPAAPRRLGRGLSILGGIGVALAGIALVLHLWWDRLWPEPEPEPVPVEPPRARMQEYALPPEEIEKAALPVTEHPPEVAAQPRQRFRRAGGGRRDSEGIELADVAWNVGKAEVPRENFEDGRQPMQGAGCSIRLGTVIPAVLETAIFSEIAQQVTARIITDVKSIDYGYRTKTLIPAGTIAIGQTVGAQELTLDRGRLAVVWHQLQNSDGFGGDRRYTQVSLGDAQGASADGSGGLGGEVNYHWGKIFAYAVLITLFNVAENEAFEDNEVGDEAASTLGQFGNRVLDRSLDWQPKISIAKGTAVQIRVQKTTRIC